MEGNSHVDFLKEGIWERGKAAVGQIEPEEVEGALFLPFVATRKTFKDEA